MNVDIQRCWAEPSAAVWFLIATVAGCAAINMHPTHEGGLGVHPPGIVSGSLAPPDSSLFAVVVESLLTIETSLPGRDRAFSINPRPLNPDPSHTFTGPEDFAAVDDRLVEQRSNLLAARWIQQFTSYTDPACRGRGSQMRREWNPAPAESNLDMVCVLLALPRPGGVHFPLQGIDEVREGIERGRWTTRVVLFGSDYYRVFDVVAEPAADGRGWRVIEQREVFSFIVQAVARPPRAHTDQGRVLLELCEATVVVIPCG